MYKIEKTNYGVKLTFDGFIQKSEMSKWVTESEQVLSSMDKGQFGVVIDMRTLVPLSEDSKQEMQKGQVLYKQKGMVRSCVILANEMLTIQFKEIAKQTGIYNWERYVDAQKNPNWEEIAIKWVKDEIDPDK